MTELENAIWAVVEQLEIMNISKKKSVSKNEHTEEVRGLIEALKFYADPDSWRSSLEFKPWNNNSIIKDDLKETDADKVLLTVFAGRRASEALKPFEREIK